MPLRRHQWSIITTTESGAARSPEIAYFLRLPGSRADAVEDVVLTGAHSRDPLAPTRWLAMSKPGFVT
jgi:hypothetical protein